MNNRNPTDIEAFFFTYHFKHILPQSSSSFQYRSEIYIFVIHILQIMKRLDDLIIACLAS
jgi:hypothetical protein